MIGSSPAMITATVIAFGRTRSTAPSSIAATQRRARGGLAAREARLPRVPQVEQHHDAELRGDARRAR